MLQFEDGFLIQFQVRTSVDLLTDIGLAACLLPPANEVCEGYVFTSVCLSTGGGACMAMGEHA